MTVSLRVADDTVTWSQFAWENGYEPATPIDEAPELVGFDRHDYTDLLTNAYGRVAEFPYDELAHRGRKFLWPWQWGWRLPKS